MNLRHRIVVGVLASLCVIVAWYFPNAPVGAVAPSHHPYCTAFLYGHWCAAIEHYWTCLVGNKVVSFHDTLKPMLYHFTCHTRPVSW